MALIPTLEDWVARNGLPAVEDGMNDDLRMTISWLQYDAAVSTRINEMIADLNGLGVSYRGILDVLSEDIINSHLGDGWCARHVDRKSAQSENYLYPDAAIPLRRLLSAQRVHDLARRLYQLQSFPWFHHTLKRLRGRDLSGASFELDVLFMLQMLPISASPRVESGVRGNDFDIEIKGLDLPVEVKAKDDDTPFSEATVINTIKGAARQFPKGSKGVVFVRIPTAWVGRNLEDTYAETLYEATRQTSRVGAIITAIDKPHLNADERAGTVTRVHHFWFHSACPERYWTAIDFLRQLLDRELTMLAPSPPF